MAREPELWTGKKQIDFLLFIADDVIEYCDWYADNGIYLPGQYISDPGQWTQILRNIQAAFELLKVSQTLQQTDPSSIDLLGRGLEQYYLYSEHLWR